MKSLVRTMLMSFVLGVFCATAGGARDVAAGEPYAISYTYHVPVTVYRAPVVVYRPAEVFYAPVPSVYRLPTKTVIYHRGPLGIFPRTTVYYSPGGYYVPAPVMVVPTPAVIYRGW